MWGFSNADRLNAMCYNIRAVCSDPINPDGWYIGDQYSIRYFDAAKDQVTLFADNHDTTRGDGRDVFDEL